MKIDPYKHAVEWGIARVTEKYGLQPEDFGYVLRGEIHGIDPVKFAAEYAEICVQEQADIKEMLDLEVHPPT